MNRAREAMSVAERLAREFHGSTVGRREWDAYEENYRDRTIGAAQALIDSPNWQITWTPPDPAVQISEAWIGADGTSEARIRRLLDDGIILPGPALGADR